VCTRHHVQRITIYRGINRIGRGQPSFPICEGKENIMCGKEFAIDHPIKSADYFSGACFGRNYSLPPQSSTPNTAGSSKQFVPPTRSRNLSDSTNKSSSTTQRRAIPLVPVDLLSANQSKPTSAQIKNSNSHWTANWYFFSLASIDVEMSEPIH
jgi:hypothetical protein